MKKITVSTVYSLGTILVAALLGIFLSHSAYVPFPETMLPTQLWELAAEWLALGTLPMLLACLWMERTWDFHGRKAVLVYLPGAVCGVSLLFWLGVWMVGILRLF